MKTCERFLDYVLWDTQSDLNSDTVPSTPGQIAFARYLMEEIKKVGVENVHLDDKGYIYGCLPASPGAEGLDVSNVPTIGFIAHIDTALEHPGPKNAPEIIRNYDGGTILQETGNILDPETDPNLKACKGQDIIVTDGTTLLSGDDKAGVAEIVEALAFLTEHPEIPHGKIAFAFTPDEEIGTSQKHFDVEAFGADFAYTVDGMTFGEIKYETFHAAKAEVLVKGMTTHPGDGKRGMKNAALIAMEFAQMLPQWERPEHTEGYEGFYHLLEMSGNCEEGRLLHYLRDHNMEILQKRKNVMIQAAELINVQYGPGTISLNITDMYRNMEEKIRPHMHLVENAKEIIQELGGVPDTAPIRGGTDGSELSHHGIPCPNLGTGSFNGHSTREVASIDQMEKCTQVIIRLAERYSRFGK